MDRKQTLSVNKSIFLIAFVLTACGGGDDFVSNQQNTIDGSIKTDGTPAADSNPDGKGNAGKYPLAEGSFSFCFNAEANGACTIPDDDSTPSEILSSAFTPSSAFVDRFTADDGWNWFRVIPYDKSLILPSFDRNTDKHYSFEYLNNTFDGLTNAVNRSIVGKDGKGNQSYVDFSNLNGYFAGDDLMLVRNVDAWGFQTIGHIIKFNDKRQIIGDSFFTVGQPLNEISGLVEATYRGIATGSLQNRSDTFAEVNAKLKLPATGSYQLDLKVSNTQIAPENLTAVGFTGTRAAPELDFSRTLKWDKDEHLFKDDNTMKGDVIARMYGPEGQEIGGQFSAVVDDYQGAFGAKR